MPQVFAHGIMKSNIMKWVVITLLVLIGFLSGMVFYLLGQAQDIKASLILTPETMGAQKTQEIPAIPDAGSLAPDSQVTDSQVPDSQTINNYSDRYQGDKIEGSLKTISKVEDCGITDGIKDMNSFDDIEHDSVLGCLGEGIINCKEVKAVINEERKGAVLYEVFNGEGNCMLKMSLGDANQISQEDSKRYANKYIQCPVESIKSNIIAMGKTPDQITNVGWGFMSFWEMGSLVFVAESNKVLALEIGCTGTLLDLNPILSAYDKNAMAKENMNQLESWTIIYFGDEYRNSYAGFSCNFNEQTIAICDEIQEDVGARPVIHASSGEYCVYIKLLEENKNKNKYFCMDNSKRKKSETSTNPATSNYCTGIAFDCPNAD